MMTELSAKFFIDAFNFILKVSNNPDGMLVTATFTCWPNMQLLMSQLTSISSPALDIAPTLTIDNTGIYLSTRDARQCDR